MPPRAEGRGGKGRGNGNGPSSLTSGLSTSASTSASHQAATITNAAPRDAQQLTGAPVASGSGSSPASASALPSSQVEAEFHRLRKARETRRATLIQEGRMQDPTKARSLGGAENLVGTCQEMCPAFELVERDMQRELDPLEQHGAPAVKIYRRPAAGREVPLPEDVRPPSILLKTLDYLFHELLPADPFDAKFSEIQAFVWNRTRAVRQDFVVQNVHGTEAIDAHERIARYHILILHFRGGAVQSSGELVHSSAHVDGTRAENTWSQQQELEQLRKTLRSLVEFYDDARQDRALHLSRDLPVSPHEGEFRAYQLLLGAYDAEALREVEALPAPVLAHPTLQSALKIRALIQGCNPADLRRVDVPALPAHGLVFFARFFSLVHRDETDYLLACVAEELFADVRRAAMRGLARAWRRRDTSSTAWLVQALGFDDEAQAFDLADQLDVRPMVDEQTGVRSLELPHAPILASKPIKTPFSRALELKRHGRTCQQVIDAPGIVPSSSAEFHAASSSLQPGSTSFSFQPPSTRRASGSAFPPTDEPTLPALGPPAKLNPLASQFVPRGQEALPSDHLPLPAASPEPAMPAQSAFRAPATARAQNGFGGFASNLLGNAAQQQQTGTSTTNLSPVVPSAFSTAFPTAATPQPPKQSTVPSFLSHTSHTDGMGSETKPDPTCAPANTKPFSFPQTIHPVSPATNSASTHVPEVQAPPAKLSPDPSSSSQLASDRSAPLHFSLSFSSHQLSAITEEKVQPSPSSSWPAISREHLTPKGEQAGRQSSIASQLAPPQEQSDSVPQPRRSATTQDSAIAPSLFPSSATTSNGFSQTNLSTGSVSGLTSSSRRPTELQEHEMRSILCDRIYQRLASTVLKKPVKRAARIGQDRADKARRQRWLASRLYDRLVLDVVPEQVHHACAVVGADTYRNTQLVSRGFSKWRNHLESKRWAGVLALANQMGQKVMSRRPVRTNEQESAQVHDPDEILDDKQLAQSFQARQKLRDALWRKGQFTSLVCERVKDTARLYMDLWPDVAEVMCSFSSLEGWRNTGLSAYLRNALSDDEVPLLAPNCSLHVQAYPSTTSEAMRTEVSSLVLLSIVECSPPCEESWAETRQRIEALRCHIQLQSAANGGRWYPKLLVLAWPGQKGVQTTLDHLRPEIDLWPGGKDELQLVQLSPRAAPVFSRVSDTIEPRPEDLTRIFDEGLTCSLRRLHIIPRAMREAQSARSVHTYAKPLLAAWRAALAEVQGSVEQMVELSRSIPNADAEDSVTTRAPLHVAHQVAQHVQNLWLAGLNSANLLLLLLHRHSETSLDDGDELLLPVVTPGSRDPDSGETIWSWCLQTVDLAAKARPFAGLDLLAAQVHSAHAARACTCSRLVTPFFPPPVHPCEAF